MTTWRRVTTLDEVVDNERAALLTEYAMLIMLVALATIATLTFFGAAVTSLYSTAQEEIVQIKLP